MTNNQEAILEIKDLKMRKKGDKPPGEHLVTFNNRQERTRGGRELGDNACLDVLLVNQFTPVASENDTFSQISVF